MAGFTVDQASSNVGTPYSQCLPSRGVSEEDNNNDHDLAGHQKRKHKIRFSRIAVKTLNDWFKAHADNPYPTEEDKKSLTALTGLKTDQINTWFANTRRRKKGRGQAKAPDVDQGTTTNLWPSATTLPLLTSGEDYMSTLTLPNDDFTGIEDVINPSHVPIADDWTDRIYQCTFCTDTFRSKYDWNRHETSLHLSLKRYVCCPISPILTDPVTNVKSCAYCRTSDPTPEHIEIHNHSQCQERDPDARTFFRKDHLRQHIRSVHDCPLLPHMDSWALEAKFINSRCGFCGQRFILWNERNDHLAMHFRDGLRMDQWKGCRGFDPAVSAEVSGAMPPFLIGVERHSPRPFSATKKGTARRSTDSGNEVSPWEMLAIQLHSFTSQRSIEGFAVSDTVLQRHARLIVHGMSDVRAQTAADNPEWLDLFKKAHIFGVIPNHLGGEAGIVEDSEAYLDLGLRMPPTVRKGRQTTFTAMFLNSKPPVKNYPRFSSLLVPPERAFQFETIAGPWPDSGILGQLIITSDWFFSLAIQMELGSSISNTSSMLLEGGEELENDIDSYSLVRTSHTSM